MRTTNNKCDQYVNDRIDFTASNLSGVNVGDDLYVVYSYGWYVLYLYDKRTGQWFENIDRYSNSTSRQKSLSRPNVDNIVHMNHDSIDKIVRAYKWRNCPALTY